MREKTFKIHSGLVFTRGFVGQASRQALPQRRSALLGNVAVTADLLVLQPHTGLVLTQLPRINAVPVWDAVSVDPAGGRLIDVVVAILLSPSHC